MFDSMAKLVCWYFVWTLTNNNKTCRHVDNKSEVVAMRWLNTGLCLHGTASHVSLFIDRYFGVCVCVCWSWQLLLVLLISGQQFLADEDKLSLTFLFLSLSFFPNICNFSLSLASCFFSSFVPSSPLLSSLPSWPARPLHPLHAFLPSVFAPSSTCLPSCPVFCFIASLVLRCHLFVLFFWCNCLWHLHICILAPDSFFPSGPLSLLILGGFFPVMLSFCLPMPFPLFSYFSHIFFPNFSPPHLFSFFLYSFYPLPHSSGPFLSLLLLIFTSSYLPFAPLFHHLLIFMDSPSLILSSLPSSFCHFCLFISVSPPFPVFLFRLFPCCVLMQNGMFYTSYVSTFPCLVK